MRKICLMLALVCCCALADWCRFEGKADSRGIVVCFTLNPGVHVYEESVRFQGTGIDGNTTRFSVAPTKGEDGAAFHGYFEAICPLPEKGAFPDNLTLTFQGCEGELCHMPRTLAVSVSGNVVEVKEVADAPSSGETSEGEYPLTGFRETARFAGYRNAEALIAWTKDARRGEGGAAESSLNKVLSRFGMLALLLLVFAMGITLNLTPCVLPMIPINLAIIGGGSATSVGMRSLRAMLYSLGMALAYGTLGVITLRTGARFGALNDSWGFNAAAGAIFVLLGLAMLELFTIDFSRWRVSLRATSFISILALGAMTALLSGACVAPVLISVLLFSAQLCSEGNAWAMALPFTLGAGMALPWPVLATGFAYMPKPGAWMVRVRQVLAVFILLLAFWYLRNAYMLFKGVEYGGRPGWHASIENAVAEARKNRMPLLVEFHGKSCKACIAMDPVLRKPEVRKEMEGWTKVTIDAAETPLARKLNVLGIPTYVLLEPPARD